jgi:hypothetical protein
MTKTVEQWKSGTDLNNSCFQAIHYEALSHYVLSETEVLPVSLSEANNASDYGARLSAAAI